MPKRQEIYTTTQFRWLHDLMPVQRLKMNAAGDAPELGEDEQPIVEEAEADVIAIVESDGQAMYEIVFGQKADLARFASMLCEHLDPSGRQMVREACTVIEVPKTGVPKLDGLRVEDALRRERRR